jgi:hypothetical protein
MKDIITKNAEIILVIGWFAFIITLAFFIA